MGRRMISSQNNNQKVDNHRKEGMSSTVALDVVQTRSTVGFRLC